MNLIEILRKKIELTEDEMIVILAKLLDNIEIQELTKTQYSELFAMISNLYHEMIMINVKK